MTFAVVKFHHRPQHVIRRWCFVSPATSEGIFNSTSKRPCESSIASGGGNPNLNVASDRHILVSRVSNDSLTKSSISSGKKPQLVIRPNNLISCRAHNAFYWRKVCRQPKLGFAFFLSIPLPGSTWNGVFDLAQLIRLTPSVLIFGIDFEWKWKIWYRRLKRVARVFDVSWIYSVVGKFCDFWSVTSPNYCETCEN